MTLISINLENDKKAFLTWFNEAIDSGFGEFLSVILHEGYSNETVELQEYENAFYFEDNYLTLIFKIRLLHEHYMKNNLSHFNRYFGNAELEASIAIDVSQQVSILTEPIELIEPPKYNIGTFMWTEEDEDFGEPPSINSDNTQLIILFQKIKEHVMTLPTNIILDINKQSKVEKQRQEFLIKFNRKDQQIKQLKGQKDELKKEMERIINDFKEWIKQQILLQ